MDDTFVGEYQSLADGHLADAESDNKKVQVDVKSHAMMRFSKKFVSQFFWLRVMVMAFWEDLAMEN